MSDKPHDISEEQSPVLKRPSPYDDVELEHAPSPKRRALSHRHALHSRSSQPLSQQPLSQQPLSQQQLYQQPLSQQPLSQQPLSQRTLSSQPLSPQTLSAQTRPPLPQSPQPLGPPPLLPDPADVDAFTTPPTRTTVPASAAALPPFRIPQMLAVPNGPEVYEPDGYFLPNLSLPGFLDGATLMLTQWLKRAPTNPVIPSPDDDISAFFGVTKPRISLHSYLMRLTRYTYCSPSTFVVAFIYVHKLGERNPLLAVNDFNVHRIVSTAIMLACKLLDDRCFSNGHYARVGGVPSVAEMGLLEELFLQLVDHELFVGDKEFNEMLAALKDSSTTKPVLLCSVITDDSGPSRENAAQTTDEVSRLPNCFSKVIQNKASTLAHHRRQSTVIEAVASSLPAQAHLLSGSAAATAYLAALLNALQSFLRTSQPVRLKSVRRERAAIEPSRFSKKQKSKQRRDDAIIEKNAASLAVNALFSASAAPADVPMDDGILNNISESAEMDQASEDTVGLLTCFISLIAMALQGCSDAVINRKCEEVLGTALTAYNHGSGYVTLAHHSNVVIATVISRLAPQSWSRMIVQRSFLYLVRHTTDRDESFRQNSERILRGLMDSPQGNLIAGKASSNVRAYFSGELSILSEAIDGGEASQRDGKPRNSTLAGLRMYIEDLSNLLFTIEICAPNLSRQDAVVICNELVSLGSGKEMHCSAQALSTVASLFLCQVQSDSGEGEEDSKEALLPKTVISKLLDTILQQNLSEDNSANAVLARASCIVSGVAAYLSHCGDGDPDEDIISVPVRWFIESMRMFNSKEGVGPGLSKCFQSLLGHKAFQTKPAILDRLVDFACSPSHPTWDDAVPVLRKYLEVGRAAGQGQMAGSVSVVVKTFVSVRTRAVSDDDRKSIAQVDSVLQSICRGGGAQFLLDAVPLKYDDDEHIKNAWLLTILRGNVIAAPFFCFSKGIVPLAEKLLEVRASLLERKRLVEAKNVDIYVLQLWSLLPGFCTEPADLKVGGTMSTAFKAIHYCLSEDREETHSFFGACALRMLATSITAANADSTASSLLGSFASRLKKLFPTLQRVVEKVNDSNRQAVLTAISVCCQAVGDPQLVSLLLQKTIRQLLELQVTSVSKEGGSNSMDVDTSEALRKKVAVVDVAIAIAESKAVAFDSKELGYLEKALSNFFQDKTGSTLQKRAYRVSTLIICNGGFNRDFDTFVQSVKRIAESKEHLAAGAKAARLGLIAATVNQHVSISDKQERIQFLKFLDSLFLSEVILGTRDGSEKCRAAGFATFLSMARGWHSIDGIEGVEGFHTFLMHVASGLGGKSPTMLAATTVSLGSLIYNFRHEIAESDSLRIAADSFFATQGHCEEQMSLGGEAEFVRPGPIAILLRHEAVEVQRAAVLAVKVATKTMNNPTERLTRALPGLLPGLLHVASNSAKKEIRLKVRLVIERLLRKCGNDAMEAAFPVEHKKLLAAVRKQFVREVTKKRAAGQARREAQAAGRSRRERSARGLPGNGVEDAGEDEESDVEAELIDCEIGTRERAGGDSLRNVQADEDVLNLLDSKSGMVLLGGGNTPTRTVGRRRGDGRNGGKKRDDGIKYTDDGKPIFVESDEDSAGAEVGSIDGDGLDSDDDKRGPGRNGRGTAVTGKRKRDTQNSSRREKRARGTLGEEYRSKRGRGDVKRAGRPDPYAYMPLGTDMFAAALPAGPRKGKRLNALQKLSTSQKGRSKIAGQSKK